MHTLLRISATTGVLLLAASLFAQPGPPRGPGGPGGFGRGFGGVGGLLMSDAVRQEISLDDSQLQELEVMRDEIRDEMRGRMGDRFRALRDMSEEERQEALADIRAEMQEIQADVEDRISGVLSPNQMDRLRQINLQQQVQRGGSQALLQGDLAEKLGITPEQQDQLREKAQEEQQKLQEQIRKLQQESRERVLSVLTDAQRAQLDQMLGTKFDMPEQRFGRQGRGRQARPPRGPGRPELE